IAAGLLAAAALGVAAYAAKGRAEKAEVDANRITRTKRQWQSTDTEAQRLAEENQKKRELIAVLAEKAVPLDGVVGTLRTLQNTVPAEIWIQTLECTRAGAATARGTKPIVQVAGFAKEIGGNIERVYSDFRQRFGKQIPLEEKDVSAKLNTESGRYD